MNTQCWDITIPPEEDSEDEDNKEDGSKPDKVGNTQGQNKKEDVKCPATSLDTAGENKESRAEDCDTTGDTATVSEDEELEDKSNETKASTSVATTNQGITGPATGPATGLADCTGPADCSDMEITCVEKSTTKPSGKI